MNFLTNTLKINIVRPLFTDTGSLMHEIKTEDVYGDLVWLKKFLILVTIFLNQNFN